LNYNSVRTSQLLNKLEGKKITVKPSNNKHIIALWEDKMQYI